MVDPVDLLLPEMLAESPVQLPRGCQVVTKGLFDDDAGLRPRDPVLVQALGEVAEERGRDREVERLDEIRPNERIVQTFTYEGVPDGVSLDILTFVDLGDGRTRVDSLSVVDTMEGRDMMIASGMETGIEEGYAALDELLAEL